MTNLETNLNHQLAFEGYPDLRVTIEQEESYYTAYVYHKNMSKEDGHMLWGVGLYQIPNFVRGIDLKHLNNLWIGIK